MPVGTAVLYRVGAPLDAVLGSCPIAVAGTREPTLWGRRLARELGRELAKRGCAVVTGFARGVDEEATWGALEAGGRAVAVLPYLLEDGALSPRVKLLLSTATKYGTVASAVAENLVKDEKHVKVWLAVRNKIIIRLATALVVPEARFKTAHWGTRYAVEYAMKLKRLVVIFKPRTMDRDVVEAFEHFMKLGAVAAQDVYETFSVVKCCSRLQVK
jgi:predicted Rossmann fold nucleotide-binding protein DprA/Smf involved in DNA uptake